MLRAVNIAPIQCVVETGHRGVACMRVDVIRCNCEDGVSPFRRPSRNCPVAERQWARIELDVDGESKRSAARMYTNSSYGAYLRQCVAEYQSRLAS
jgi:hypothetical protein